MLKRFRAAPLSSGFLLTSILGFIITIFYFNKINQSFAFTFLLIFGIMFIAALISMAKAPVEAEIAMDHHTEKSGKK